MSKITNPDIEPSVNCGFFDSLAGDRKYYTSDVSSLFDGIIRDGIFQSIGDAFVVTANGTDTTITVGTGKCWFNRTFTENNADLIVSCPKVSSVLNRIDAVVIEIDKSTAVRDCFIKVISGSGSSGVPKRPEMTRDDVAQKYQYALCYIYREKGSTVISQADITDVRGYNETPFVTGILKVLNSENLLKQWDAKFKDFLTTSESNVGQLLLDAVDRMDKTITENDVLFGRWFSDITSILNENAAANLLAEINEDEIERLLVSGLTNGTKTFSDDGSVITSVDDANGYQLVKTFSSDFSTCTIILTKAGSELGRLVKTFNSDGSISSELTIN